MIPGGEDILRLCGVQGTIVGADQPYAYGYWDSDRRVFVEEVHHPLTGKVERWESAMPFDGKRRRVQ